MQFLIILQIWYYVVVTLYSMEVCHSIEVGNLVVMTIGSIKYI